MHDTRYRMHDTKIAIMRSRKLQLAVFFARTDYPLTEAFHYTFPQAEACDYNLYISALTDIRTQRSASLHDQKPLLHYSITPLLNHEVENR